MAYGISLLVLLLSILSITIKINVHDFGFFTFETVRIAFKISATVRGRVLQCIVGNRVLAQDSTVMIS